MSAERIPDRTRLLKPIEQLRLLRDVVHAEGQFLLDLATRLDRRWIEAAERLADCTGCVVVTGIGKAGLIGQKLVATLCSTGTRAHFLHPSEAVHGDLGKVGRSDVVVVLSYSGRSDEVVRLLPALRDQAECLIAITAEEGSPVGSAADLVLELGPIGEACPLGLAPSTSTTAMLAAGDAVALLASQLRGFTAGDFARFHPAGSLGQKLAPVEEVMRPRDRCRVASEDETVRSVMVLAGRPGRRSGAVLLVDRTGKLSGIFTDSDLARLLASRRDAALDRPIAEVMTREPRCVAAGTRLRDAVSLLAQYQISELPVLDAAGQPLGMLDITDIVGVATPAEGERAEDTARGARSSNPAPGQRPTVVRLPTTP